MEQKAYDILIVGGGVMGSSIAYHLLNDGLDSAPRSIFASVYTVLRRSSALMMKWPWMGSARMHTITPGGTFF
jgi:hypothetical protein